MKPERLFQYEAAAFPALIASLGAGGMSAGKGGDGRRGVMWVRGEAQTPARHWGGMRLLCALSGSVTA